MSISVTKTPEYLVTSGKDELEDTEKEFISNRPRRQKHTLQTKRRQS